MVSVAPVFKPPDQSYAVGASASTLYDKWSVVSVVVPKFLITTLGVMLLVLQ